MSLGRAKMRDLEIKFGENSLSRWEGSAWEIVRMTDSLKQAPKRQNE